MAGQNPAGTGGIVANMAGQIAASDPEPISATVLGAVARIAAIFGAAHAAAVKKEAQTLSAAVPQWRQLTASVVDAYNSGQIDASTAVSYIENAKGLYYQQVKDIQRGTWPYQGTDFNIDYYDSYASRSGPTGSASKNPDAHAPDPCNGACVVGHYWIEREALMIEQAINSGQSVTIPLEAIAVANTGGQGGAAESQLVISPPLGSTIIPAGVYSALPAIVKQNPLIFAGLALFAGVLVFGGRRA